MGEKVRIGIQAPQKVPVFRKEIYLEIHREAGGVPADDGGHPASGEGRGQGKVPDVEGPLRELGEKG
jgi:Global regulator protein family